MAAQPGASEHTESSESRLFTEILRVCREGQREQLRYILGCEKDVQKALQLKTAKGYTIIHEAVDAEQPDIVQILLLHGMSPNLRARGGVTPLHIAASKTSVGCVRALVDNGADITLRDDLGHDAMHKAEQKSTRKRETVVKVLRSKEIILHSSRGENRALERKLSSQPKPEIRDIDEALLVAVKNGHNLCIPVLVVAGARGLDCALYLAIQLEQIESIAILLLCKATIVGNCTAIRSLLSEPPESDNVPWYMPDVHRVLANGAIKMSYPIAVSIMEKNFESTKELLLKTDLDMGQKRVDWSKLKLTVLHSSWVYSIAPWVVSLKLVNNHLRKLPKELFQALQLRRLDLSQNLLETVPAEIFGLPNLEYLCLAHNQLVELTDTNHWSPSLLTLDLADNRLTTLPNGIQHSAIEILNLSKNQFSNLPKCLCRIRTLTSLDLSHMPLSTWPKEMENLDRLVSLVVTGTNISDLAGRGGILRGGLRGVFKAKSRSSKPCNYVKLILLCHSTVAKKVMLFRLKSHFNPQEELPDMEIFQWTFRPLLSFRAPKLHFNTWLVGSTFEVSSLYPCLFTPAALNVIVWDLSKTADMREQIKLYVDMLVRHVPHANVFVIIVLSEQYENWADVNSETLHKRLKSFFSVQCYRSLHYLGMFILTANPNIKDGHTEMKQSLYEVAMGMTLNNQTLVTRLCPENYFSLIPVIEKEQKLFAARELPGIVEETALWTIFQQALPADPPDIMELPVIVEFLQETGFLLHYEDPNDHLDQYYFLQPVWLYQALLRILCQSLENPGRLIVTTSELVSLTSINWSHSATAPLIRLMIRYAIIIPIRPNQFLITCLLPHCNPNATDLFCGNLRRQFAPKMKPLPSDLWSRLVGRILSDLPRIVSSVGDSPHDQARDASSRKKADSVVRHLSQEEGPLTSPKRRGSEQKSIDDGEPTSFTRLHLANQSHIEESDDELMSPSNDNCSGEKKSLALRKTSSSSSVTLEEKQLSGCEGQRSSSDTRRLSESDQHSPTDGKGPESQQPPSRGKGLHESEEDEQHLHSDGKSLNGSDSHTLSSKGKTDSNDSTTTQVTPPTDGTTSVIKQVTPPTKSDKTGREMVGVVNDGTRSSSERDSKDEEDLVICNPSHQENLSSESGSRTKTERVRSDSKGSRTRPKRSRESSYERKVRPSSHPRFRKQVTVGSPYRVKGQDTVTSRHATLPDTMNRPKPQRLVSVPAKGRTRAHADPVLVEKYTVVWDTGVVYRDDTVQFSVYPCLSEGNVEERGIEVCSNRNDTGRVVLARVCRVVQKLLEERYPQLFSVDYNLQKHELTQLALCAQCLENGERRPNGFIVEACVYALGENVQHNCRYHPETVPVHDMVPDYLMLDLPSHLRLGVSQFHLDEGKLLHQGKTANLFHGTFNGQKVAVKKYKHADGKSITLPLSFVRQDMEILSVIQHPNIVRTFGYCLKPPCVLIEKAPLGNLYEKLMDTDQKISRLIRFHVCCQVTSALSYLHGKNIVYRTLKASSILVWSLDFKDEVNVKLTNLQRASFKAPSGLLGKPSFSSYPAPEMLKYSFREEYSEKVDIYSFGILLYELVTRWQPFTGISSMPANPRPKLSSSATSGYATLVRVMEDCWQEDPSLRPSAFSLLRRISQPSFQCHIASQVLRDCVAVRGCCFVPSVRQIWVYGEYDQMALDNDGMVTEGTQVFIVNADNLTIQGSLEVKERVSAILAVDNKVWIGMTEACVHAYDTTTFQFTDRLHLADSVTCIASNDTFVFVAQANGHLRCYHKLMLPKENRAIDIPVGEKAIIAMQTVGDIVWLSCGNELVIISTEDEVTIETRWDACGTNDQVYALALSKDATLIWSLVRGELAITSWDVHTGKRKHRVDLTNELNWVCCEINYDPTYLRLVSLECVEDTLWLGLTCGVIVILTADEHPRIISQFRAHRNSPKCLLDIPRQGGSRECPVVLSGGFGEITHSTNLITEQNGVIVLWQALTAEQFRLVAQRHKEIQRLD